MGDGELTRDGTRLAVTFDYGANKKLAFFAVTGGVGGAYPDAACTTTTPDERYADPSWSPDGSGIAYQSSAGVEVARFSAFGKDTCAIASSSVLSATASEPDWGPADPPAAPYAPPAQTQQPVTTPPTQRKFTVKVPRVTVAALRRGLKIRVSAPATAKIAKGRKTLARAKSRNGMIRFGKVHAKRGLKLKLTVSSGGQVVTRTVKVR